MTHGGRRARCGARQMWAWLAAAGSVAGFGLVLAAPPPVSAAGAYTLAPDVLEFPVTPIGTTATLPLTLTKVGGDPEPAPPAPETSEIDPIEAPFAMVSGSCSGTDDGFFDVGDSCTAVVGFTPTSEGDFSDEFVLLVGVDETFTVKLIGTGVDLGPPVDLGVVKSVSDSFVDVSGGPVLVTWTVEVTNAGAPKEAPTVSRPSFVDVLPPGVKLADTPAGCTFDLDTGELGCESPAPLGPGETWIVTYEAWVLEAGSHTNVVTTRPIGQVDGSPRNDMAKATVVASDGTMEPHDVAVGKRVEKTPLAPGSPAIFELDWKVVSGTAPEVTVVDHVPSGMTVLSVGPGCALVGSTVTCTKPGPLGAGSSGTFWVTATSTTTGTFTNEVTLVPGDLETDPSNDTATADVTYTDDFVCGPSCLQDVAIDKTVDDEFPEFGQQVTFTLAWSVGGTEPVDGVTVFDLLPAGLSLVSYPTACDLYDERVLVCAIPGPFDPGTSGSLAVVAEVGAFGVLTNVAAIETFEDLDDEDPTNSVDSATIYVLPPEGDPCAVLRCEADVALQKNPFPDDQFAVGGLAGFVLIAHVTATPGSVVPSIRIVDTLPDGLSFVSGPGCSAAGQEVTCTADGPFGNDQVVAFAIITTSSVAGHYENVAVVKPDGWTDTNPDNDQAVAEVEFADLDLCEECPFNLQVTKTVDNPNPLPGDTVTFTITVTNKSGGARAAVRLYELVPDGLVYLGVSQGERVSTCDPFQFSEGGAEAKFVGVRVCEFGEGLDPGESDVTQIRMLVSEACSSWTNVALLEGQPEGEHKMEPMHDNLATARVDVGGQCGDKGERADLSVQKTVQSGTVQLGSQFSYDIAYRNLGPDPATDVHVVDVLPAGLELVSVPGGCTVADRTITCIDPYLPVDEQRSVTVVVRAVGLGTLLNEASAVAHESDPVLANNNDRAQASVLPPLSTESDLIPTGNLPSAGSSAPLQLGGLAAAVTLIGVLLSAVGVPGVRRRPIRR